MPKFHDMRLGNVLSVLLSALLLLVGCLTSIVILPYPQWIPHVLFLPVVLHIISTDLRFQQIYVVSIFMALVLGIAFVALSDVSTVSSALERTAMPLLSGLLIAFVFWLANSLYRHVRGVTGIATGDVMLFGIAAVWVPLEDYSIFLMLACVGALSLVLVGAARNLERPTSSARVPFGAFQVASIWMTTLMSGSFNLG